MEFKNRIKKLRKDKKLTQSQLSELTGITTSLISKYENGSKEVGLDNREYVVNNIVSRMQSIFRNASDEEYEYEQEHDKSTS